MIAPAALLTFALLLGLVVAPLLNAAAWPSRAPGIGMVAWLVLTTSSFSSLVLAGLSVTVPELPAADGLADFFNACSNAMREHYGTTGGATIAVAGGGFTLALALRVVLVSVGRGGQRRRIRRRHLDLVRMVGRPHARSGVFVVDHPVPAAYCVPGRPGHIVISQGAVTTLSELELEQVLRHEAAHLARHHHWMISIADSIAATMFGALGSARACTRMAELAEMEADDAADPRGRGHLAQAVLKLAEGAVQPVGVLSAAGGGAEERVRRLADATPSIGTAMQAALLAACAVTLVLPVTLAVLPAMDVISQLFCPLIG